MRWDVIVGQRANVALDDDAAELIATTDGVESGHPILYNTLEVDGGEQYEAWGLPPDTELYQTDIAAGRWLEPADDTASAGRGARAGACEHHRCGRRRHDHRRHGHGLAGSRSSASIVL